MPSCSPEPIQVIRGRVEKVILPPTGIYLYCKLEKTILDSTLISGRGQTQKMSKIFRTWRVCSDRWVGGDWLRRGAQSHLDDVAGANFLFSFHLLFCSCQQMFSITSIKLLVILMSICWQNEQLVTIHEKWQLKENCNDRISAEHQQCRGLVHIHWGLHRGQGESELHEIPSTIVILVIAMFKIADPCYGEMWGVLHKILNQIKI